MPVRSVLIASLGLGHAVVLCGWEPWVARPASGRSSRSRFGREYEVGPGWTPPGSPAPLHGPTAAHASFARHDIWSTRAFEDLVVYDAICSSRLDAARGHDRSGRTPSDRLGHRATPCAGRSGTSVAHRRSEGCHGAQGPVRDAAAQRAERRRSMPWRPPPPNGQVPGCRRRHGGVDGLSSTGCHCPVRGTESAPDAPGQPLTTAATGCRPSASGSTPRVCWHT